MRPEVEGRNGLSVVNGEDLVPGETVLPMQSGAMKCDRKVHPIRTRRTSRPYSHPANSKMITMRRMSPIPPLG